MGGSGKGPDTKNTFSRFFDFISIYRLLLVPLAAISAKSSATSKK
jgi:hypothetical protein